MDLIDNRDLLQAAEILAENKEMQVAITSNSKSAFLVGCSTLFGVLAFGPVGLAVGEIYIFVLVVSRRIHF